MINQTDDHGARILREIAEKLGDDIPLSLVFDLYQIQRDHQFEKDPSIANLKMEQRILAEVDRQKVS